MHRLPARPAALRLLWLRRSEGPDGEGTRMDMAEKEPVVPPADAVQSARAAGLRYIRDDRPGIRRVRSGTGFRYVGPDGRAVRDVETLRRIRSLVIPPAWADVWICPHANGHLQA